MAKSQQQRDNELVERRKELDDRELRHRVRPGIHEKLQDLMAWHGITEKSEAIQLMIMNAHAAGPAGSASHLSIPRHEITISPNVARALAEFVPPAEPD
ncbi:hypothetical protein [Pseudomonas indica]|uniref:hypothetical protein n=1 Tax=Pseudomonas indica TaxID=137658 RepID=UPI003FD134AC